MRKPKILIVEDEAIIAFELKLKLKKYGYSDTFIVYAGEQAVQFAAENAPQVILMDIMLRGKMTGIEAANQIHEQYQVPIIYLTGNTHYKDDPRFLQTEPLGIISKPYNDKLLLDLIKQALD